MIREEWLKELPDWDSIKEKYLKWYAFMEEDVIFSFEDSQKHTKEHCARVMLYALTIAHRLGLPEQAQDMLGIASAFHDSRRLDDWLDVGHGQRAADYYREYCQANQALFEKAVYLMIAYHDRDDTIGIEQLDRAQLENGVLLYKILKDADALDRFRLAANALNVQMLRTNAAGGLVTFAKHLVEKMLPVRPISELYKYLIVVDMQNDFVAGTLGTPQAQEMSEHAAKKVQQYAGNVIFTMDSHSENYLATQEGKLLPVKHCITGTSGWQLIPIMAAIQAERAAAIYRKQTFGSVKLIQDLSEFHARTPIEEIELIGLCTDVCVVSNALLLKAALPEVPIFVDADCCAGTTPENHKAALQVMKSCHIRIRERGA